ncbi:MAG: hypothetical protein ACPGWR_04350 [Ardenticatenaceae bacterium]
MVEQAAGLFWAGAMVEQAVLGGRYGRMPDAQQTASPSSRVCSPDKLTASPRGVTGMLCYKRSIATFRALVIVWAAPPYAGRCWALWERHGGKGTVLGGLGRWPPTPF